MIYDLVIIGSGISGYSAGLYAGRFNLKTAIITGANPGGATVNAWIVENYPGAPNIKGYELISKVESQARDFGAEIINEVVKSVEKQSSHFLVKTTNQIIETKTVLVATGTEHRKLNLLKEEELTGKGVCYCATCDGPLYRNKKGVVVGGGDSGIKAALLLKQYTDDITVLTNEPHIRAEPINLKKFKEAGISVILENTITELVEKDGRLVAIKLSKPYNHQQEIALDGLFIEIGGIPNTGAIKNLGVKTDNNGYIDVDWQMQTNIPGVYGAGDITTAFGNFKQMITAAAQGAAAANFIYSHLRSK